MHVAVGRAGVCLTMCVAASALTVLLIESTVARGGGMTHVHAINGMTIGFAAICSNILTCEPWAALIAGLVAGLVYVWGRRLLRSLKDNDVFTVHGLGGLWGLLFTGFLAKPKFIRDVIGVNYYPARLLVSLVKGDGFTGKVAGIEPLTRHSGVFYPKKGPNGKLLGCMLLESVAVFLWGLVLAVPLFGILAAARKLEVRGSLRLPACSPAGRKEPALGLFQAPASAGFDALSKGSSPSKLLADPEEPLHKNPAFLD